jgi:AraC-like DNA-binding protein
MHGYVSETLDDQVFSEEAVLYSELIVKYLLREAPLTHVNKDIDLKLHMRISQLWLRVADDLARTWTVEQLSAEVNLSERHFYRKVREIYNENPNQILRRMRIERAKEFIRANEHSLKEITSNVGYQDYFAFLSAFKRYTGMTTTEYQKKIND